MSCDNCKSGFKWDGTATGKETTLDSAKAYVTGDNAERAICRNRSWNACEPVVNLFQ